MADFGGPDASSAGLIIQANQFKQTRKLEQQKMGIDSLFKGIDAYQTGQQIDLKKEDQTLDRQKFEWEKDPTNPDNKYREQVAAKYAREATPEALQLELIRTKREIQKLDIEILQNAMGGFMSDWFNRNGSNTDGSGLEVDVSDLLLDLL